MEQISPETGALLVETPQGESVRLDSLWASQPALLVLVRHYGCQFCRGQIADMREAVPSILEAGVQPIVIGNGTPLMAEAFVEETGLSLPLFTNPGREVYRALGTKRPGVGAFVDPRLWWNFLRYALKGRFAKKIQGDAAQLGGVFLVKPGGQMTYAYRSDLAGDHPSNAALIEAARAATRS